MKNTFLFFVLLALSTFAYSSSYLTYQNDRFDYQINYPDILKPQGESDNSDGQKFTNNTSQLIVWGSYAPQTINESYQYALKDLKDYKITYSTKKHDFFAISAANATQIAYFKMIFLCDSNINIRLYYPKSEIKKWDAIVKEIVKSFHFNFTKCVKN